jgi:hypothetical protein
MRAHGGEVHELLRQAHWLCGNAGGWRRAGLGSAARAHAKPAVLHIGNQLPRLRKRVAHSTSERHRLCRLNPASGGNAGVGLSITQKPTLGEAGIRNSYSFAYRSFRAGADRFQVRRDGLNSLGKPYTSLLNVNVRVTE